MKITLYLAEGGVDLQRPVLQVQPGRRTKVFINGYELKPVDFRYHRSSGRVKIYALVAVGDSISVWQWFEHQNKWRTYVFRYPWKVQSEVSSLR